MNWKFSKERLFFLSISALIFSALFQDFISLPWLPARVELTEFILIPVLLFFPYEKLRNSVFDKRARWIFALIAFYLLINVVSSIVSGSGSSLIESIARIYLALLFFILIIFFDGFTAIELSNYLSRLFLYIGLLAALLSLSGYFLLAFGIENSMIIRLDEYPYLGTVYRLRGPTFTPTMLATILVPCIFFPLANYHQLPFRKTTRLLVFILIVLTAFLTFSKSFLIIAWGLFIWGLYKVGKLRRSIILLTVLPLLVVLFIATHFVFAKPGSDIYKKYLQTTFISESSAFSAGEWQALETSYFLNKKIALEIAKEHPLIGIGTGNFNAMIDDYKSKGLYPKRFFSYDPHSTWLGALAENGISGFLVIISFLLLLYIPYTHTRYLKTDPAYLAIFIIFSFFIIEGIATDILNFRHFWIFLAISFVYHRKAIKAMD